MERWNSHELVADDYELKSLVQDLEGLIVIAMECSSALI